MVDEHFIALRRALEDMHGTGHLIDEWGRHIAEHLASGGRLLACGNGGSAAEAQHLTGELVGRFRHDRRPLSAIALHADTSATTAISNDYGDEEVFARQVRAHGRLGDVLVAISTSGRSRNVLAAAKAAHEVGMTALALTGLTPNELASICDGAVTVPAPDVATVQEVHLVVVHALCEVIDDALGVVAPAVGWG
ncbi:MAG: gmhA [Pseudonocardia sp.]|jgi:D-sedoheptulose 7-phosphate isomerase|nr:gmhA [Pseudonocardia sp.]